MPKDTIYPPGDKITKAIKEFSEEVKDRGPAERKKILQKIIMKYDLSPKESTFMESQFKEE